jgi:hypothetical protein
MSFEQHAIREFRAAGWVDESGKFSDENTKIERNSGPFCFINYYPISY